MTREEEILKRGSELPVLLRNKFENLLVYYVEHNTDHDNMLNKLEEFLNNIEKEKL